MVEKLHIYNDGKDKSAHAIGRHIIIARRALIDHHWSSAAHNSDMMQ